MGHLRGRLGSVVGGKFSVVCVSTRGLITCDRRRNCLINSHNSMNSSFITAVTKVSRIGPLPPRCIYPGYRRDRFFAGNRINSNFSLPRGGYPVYNRPLVHSKRSVPFRAFLNFGNSGMPSVSLGFSSRFRGRIRGCARRLFNDRGMFGTNAVSAVTRGATFNFTGTCTRGGNVALDGTRLSHLTGLIRGDGVGAAANRRPTNVVIMPHAGAVCSFYPVRCPTGGASSNVVAARFSFRSVRSAVLGLSRLNRIIPAACGCLRRCANVPMSGISVDSRGICDLFASARTLNMAPRSVNSGANACYVPRFNANFMHKVLRSYGPGGFTSLLRVSNLSRNASICLNGTGSLVSGNAYAVSRIVNAHSGVVICLVRGKVRRKLTFGVARAIHGNVVTDNGVSGRS